MPDVAEMHPVLFALVAFSVMCFYLAAATWVIEHIDDGEEEDSTR